MTEMYALMASGLLAALALFQLSLALGAPLGEYAWGGGHRILPTKLRIGSLVSILLYLLFALIILEAAGVISLIESDGITDVGIWVLVGYLSLGIIMNAISRSRKERIVMTPVAAVLAGLYLLVALGRSG